MYLNLTFEGITTVLMQAHSQKFAMGWGCFGGLGAEPPALENFAFFCKNNLILGMFWYKIMLLKRGIEIGSANLIKLLIKTVSEVLNLILITSKDVLNHFLVHFSTKNSFRSAKNVVFFLFCILVDKPMGRATAPSSPAPWLRYWFHASISLLIGSSATLCVGSPYVFSGIFYEFVNKNKKQHNFETAEGRNFKFRS